MSSLFVHNPCLNKVSKGLTLIAVISCHHISFITPSACNFSTFFIEEKQWFKVEMFAAFYFIVNIVVLSQPPMSIYTKGTFKNQGSTSSKTFPPLQYAVHFISIHVLLL